MGLIVTRTSHATSMAHAMIRRAGRPETRPRCLDMALAAFVAPAKVASPRPFPQTGSGLVFLMFVAVGLAVIMAFVIGRMSRHHEPTRPEPPSNLSRKEGRRRRGDKHRPTVY